MSDEGLRLMVRMATIAVLLAPAAPSGALADRTWVGWSGSWENDSFNPFSQKATDQHYTNGLRFVVARDPEFNWGWAEALGPRLPLRFGTQNTTTTSALLFGQNFFTPTIITQSTVDPTDRPYAGFLYVGGQVAVTFEPVERPQGGPTANTQQSLEWNVGLLGPAALAEQTQKAVHLLREGRIPKGWDHQIRTELAVNALYLFRVRAGWSWLDAIPQAGAALGTIQTYLTAGTLVRVGRNMRGFPSPIIPWSAAPIAGRPDWELAAFAGGDARLLARNAYLDGNLLGGEPHVEKKRLVGDLRAGVTVRRRSWRLTYNLVWRGPEFTGPYGERHHNFGSISLGRELGVAQ